MNRSPPCRPDVTLITCVAHPALPVDDAVLVDSLRRRGLRVVIAPWDAAVTGDPSCLTVLRAAWTSHLDPRAFIQWLDRTAGASSLLNGHLFIRWNFDKRYLIELGQRGAAVIPTALLESANAEAIEKVLHALPAGDIVVKPRYGAESYGTARVAQWEAHERIAAHFPRFGSNGGLLVQPFIPAVERERERSLVFIDGLFSHALYREPFGLGPTIQSPDNIHTPSEEELGYCHALFDLLPHRLTYARVDLIPLAAGPALMELEAIDPSLFFQAAPEAARRLAEAIDIRLQELR